jgi:hypothetical protein
MQANSLLFRYFYYVDGPSYSSASLSLARVRKGIILDQLVYQPFDLFVIVKIIVLYGMK